MSKLIENIRHILNFCEINVSKRAIKTGSGQATIATHYLLGVANSLKRMLSQELLSETEITVSYGSGYFPKVPWVAVVPLGKKVSNSISVTICFGSSGEGIVAGAMFPNKVTQGQFKTFNRIDNPNENEHIDISGVNHRTKYNNKYINPKDFGCGFINEEELINHLNDSLIIMKDYLKQTPGTWVNIK